MADESIQSMGGKARAESLTDEQRKEIAQNAAAARWNIPKADYFGTLKIGGAEIPCFVLQDGRRVISGRGLTAAIGMKGRGQGVARIATHKLINTNENKDLVVAIEKPIKFVGRSPKGLLEPSDGFEAIVLQEVCEALLKARDNGLPVTEQDQRYVKCADILIRSFAKIGIIALVDEATGYEEVRDKLALQKILEKYITDEWAKWSRTFPEDFYKNLFRLKGLKYPYDTNSKRKPSFVGHWTNDIVYSRLAPGVLEELRKKNPRHESGGRSRKHHQHLTRDYGHPALKELLSNVTFLMKSCQNDAEFKRKLNFSAPKYTDTPMLLDV
jgi:hypothetical protein